MCGIVGASAKRNVAGILVDGLKRLEYRGYDSAGVAIIDPKQSLTRIRTCGKVRELEEALRDEPLLGTVGIAHTRWATHGAPNQINAHPHVSLNQIAVVHNGIIENYETIREQLKAAGYEFVTETDSEVIAHLFHYHYAKLKNTVKAAAALSKELTGAFGVGIINTKEPNSLLAIRSGSPLVLGLGIGENFVASDHLALLPITSRFIYLEEGDIAEISAESYAIYDQDAKPVTRKIIESKLSSVDTDRGQYRHFMQKEIFAQPAAIQATLEGRMSPKQIFAPIFGEQAPRIFDVIDRVQIVACGTSYHAGLIARNWLESLAGIPCQVEIASEYRYRKAVIEPNTLLVTLSQSGETADTLAALRIAKKNGLYSTLAICNVPESSLVRESDLVLMTHAGVEIGVASTKAFTTQLTALLMLTIVLGRKRLISPAKEAELLAEMKNLPHYIQQALALDEPISKLAERFVGKRHALFLGRGAHYPIALEGALKLKEISYIHAEAYPAGELKHGPLALVDSDMPVVTVAPNDELLEKLKSNLQEVRARGGELYVFADSAAKLKNGEGTQILEMPSVPAFLTPIVYSVPLQLLAYHVAVLKGTDVDQPRNLAKSVTVE
jgi:glucosamine--fructose-6-phosphate aminotransferase (isomerizing)